VGKNARVIVTVAVPVRVIVQETVTVGSDVKVGESDVGERKSLGVFVGVKN